MIIFADTPNEVEDFIYRFDILEQKTAVITVLQEDENLLTEWFNDSSNIHIFNQINLHDKICGARARHIIFIKAGLMVQKVLQVIISGYTAVKSNPIEELKRC